MKNLMLRFLFGVWINYSLILFNDDGQGQGWLLWQLPEYADFETSREK